MHVLYFRQSSEKFVPLLKHFAIPVGIVVFNTKELERQTVLNNEAKRRNLDPENLKWVEVQQVS